MCIFTKIYQPNPTVVARKIGDQVVLIPTQHGVEDFDNVFTLNNMAAGIWVQIDGKTPISTIKERVLESFEVETEEVEKDLIDLLSQLEELGMISVHP